MNDQTKHSRERQRQRIKGRPFWHDSTARIYMGDCLDVLAAIPSGSIDAVVTDPPYCSGGLSEAQRASAKSQGVKKKDEALGRIKWFGSDNMTTGGLVWLLRSVCVEAARVLRPSGSCLLFTDWRMVPMLVPALESSGLRYRALLVWDKGTPGLGVGFRSQHEMVIHLSSNAAKFHSKATGNVFRAKRVHHLGRMHPTQKPVDLLRQLIGVVCPPGGVVLDPFMGAGSTGVAARMDGRQFVGIEREHEFCQAARARLLETATGAPS